MCLWALKLPWSLGTDRQTCLPPGHRAARKEGPPSSSDASRGGGRPGNGPLPGQTALSHPEQGGAGPGDPAVGQVTSRPQRKALTQKGLATKSVNATGRGGHQSGLAAPSIQALGRRGRRTRCRVAGGLSEAARAEWAHAGLPAVLAAAPDRQRWAWVSSRGQRNSGWHPARAHPPSEPALTEPCGVSAWRIAFPPSSPAQSEELKAAVLTTPVGPVVGVAPGGPAWDGSPHTGGSNPGPRRCRLKRLLPLKPNKTPPSIILYLNV